MFCNDVDNALIQMDAGKLNIETANSMLASVSFDSETGKFTFKELDGTTYEYDLNLEKIPVSFTLTEDGILTMTTEDGTQWTCNIADLIKDYVFDDSDTIAFEKEFVEEDDEGKGSYHVTASVKAGSINETHLNPDYRSDILTYTTQAQTAANDSLTYSKDSKRWAVGDSEYEGSATDNAKYYKEQAEAAKQAAEEARDEAQAATGTVIATTEQVGVVKPDGTTIKVDEDGTIHGANQFDGSGYTYVDGEAIDPPSTSDEAILDADKLGGQLPNYYAADANVVKKTDISNVQADSTSTVPSSALLKSTDDKIGDTSNLPGDASDMVSAITQLNSDMQNHFPPGLIWQTNSSNTYRYGFGSGRDGYMYIDNQNLSTRETTRLQFSKNGALDLLTINDGEINYIGHFISDADFATGTARIQTTNGELSTSQISFGKTFSSTPKVFCNIKTSVPSNKWVNAGNISTTGFTIYADVDVTGTITVDWFAVAI